MKIKTQDLTGPALNWAVRKTLHPGSSNEYVEARGNYSTCWNKGGPIIERERIKVAPNLGGSWHGQMRHEKEHPLVDKPVLAGWTNKHGPTPLIAAMRCFVASRLGDEVDVPGELLLKQSA